LSSSSRAGVRRNLASGARRHAPAPDPGAPILSVAHYAIVGDLNTVIPQMIKAFKAKA